jgi:hypothetical protein
MKQYTDTGPVDHYEVVDINVVSTDGKHATADVTWMRNRGDLTTSRVEYAHGLFESWHCPELPEELADEVTAECKEAVMYQRDLNRAKN